MINASTKNMSKPIVQIAIDAITIDEAITLGKEAVEAGADWLEVGNPLVKFEGLRGIKTICETFPNKYILIDYMILSGSHRYIKAAKEAGANNVTVTALAPDETVQECINGCKQAGIDCTVDLFNKGDLVNNAKKYEKMGADYIMVHFGVDQKKFHPKGSPIMELKEVAEAVSIPVSYATYDSIESRNAVKAGASIIVQGEPLLSMQNSKEAIKEFILKTKNS